MERIILHCDCNSFFASVEAVLEPSLKGSAFAVCGDKELRHGIILAKSDIAKSCGVKTGEAIWQAKQKCPQLKLVTPTYGAYEDFSHRIYNIYCRYTDLVEPFGMDECWLDVTGTAHIFGSGKKIADELRQTIREETGVTISAGVSFNKLFAKLGSDYKKPDATTCITKQNFKQLLYPLPVTDMFGVGRAAEQRLKSLGIFTIGDLARADYAALEAVLGKSGRLLGECANGIEYSAVNSTQYQRQPKSIGNGATFKHDLVNDAQIRTAVFVLADKVCSRLREHEAECATLQVTVKRKDLSIIQHQAVLERPTQLTNELAYAALKLIGDVHERFEPIRAITLTGQQLQRHGKGNEQISFFFLKEQLGRFKHEELENAKDAIRSRYGSRAITQCSLINNDMGL